MEVSDYYTVFTTSIIQEIISEGLVLSYLGFLSYFKPKWIPYIDRLINIWNPSLWINENQWNFEKLN